MRFRASMRVEVMSEMWDEYEASTSRIVAVVARHYRAIFAAAQRLPLPVDYSVHVLPVLALSSSPAQSYMTSSQGCSAHRSPQGRSISPLNFCVKVCQTPPSLVQPTTAQPRTYALFDRHNNRLACSSTLRRRHCSLLPRRSHPIDRWCVYKASSTFTHRH